MAHLLEQFIETRNKTTQLCSPLSVEDYIPQAAEFTSPPKWHLAHTTWFFEKMILSNFLDYYVIFNKDYDFLFNSYYNTLGKRVLRKHRGMITRPNVAETYEYRAHVDANISILLSKTVPEKIRQLVIMGINHEQQHQELLITDLKYAFSLNPTNPIYDTLSNLVGTHNNSSGWFTFSEGVYDIGHASKSFSFDNELARHKVYVNDFEISKALVTNGEFIEFIEAGGYTNFNFWLDEGWSWLLNEKIKSPLYWQNINGKWCYYTLAGLCEVDPHAILAHISYFEANAFATWKGYRLPTEFEWEIASYKTDWGERWEWTNSAYLPYPGFKIAEGAVGEYNGKFMVNQMVLRGSSIATPQGHSRNTYRNFFQTHSRWQFTGIRLTKSTHGAI
jgi:ergothioneine biosynthesis protein EgtB